MGEPTTFVAEPSCTVRTRIGFLMGSHDVWWPIDDPDTPTAVTEAASAHALRYLERMHSRHAMAEELKAAGVMRHAYPLPKIYLAVLQHELGGRVDACAALAELQSSTSGPWRSRVDQVAANIGCSLTDGESR